MIVVGPALFLLGLGVCWSIGRYLDTDNALLVPAATALFGIAGLITGFPNIWNDNLIWALVVLAVYGAIGSILFRSGRALREGSE